MDVISVSRANCKNCYRCVRHCPVKAIKITGGQAEVVDRLCLYCGSCVTECPQNAKKVRNDLDAVKQFIQAGEKVLASIAPSYPAAFGVDSPGEMFYLLKNLGFCGAEETAVGAELVSVEYRRLIEEGQTGPIITTACPVVKNLAEKYHPGLIGNLAPVVSPMVAHARLLKQRYGRDVKVVFIGPCIAKKAEARDRSVAGDVDAVLTFRELMDWLEEKAPAAARVESENLEGARQPFIARSYPLPGGLLKTSSITGDLLSREVVVVDGMEDCMELLDALERKSVNGRLFEMMACRGGCIGGPLMPTGRSLYERRQRLLSFIENNRWQADYRNIEVDGAGIDLRRSFEPKAFKAPRPTEPEIREILASIGKATPEKELNCGACGYPSCRKKAEAVYQGMAEPDMCIPYMRSRAESLANLIIDHAPNGIILVDGNMNIKEINKAAEKMFNADREQVIGKPLSTIIDDRDFAWVLANKTGLQDKKVNYPLNSLITLQTICYIGGEDLVLAIIQDITEQEKHRMELERVREETLEKAQEVINRQMRVAQEIAGLLGETTAESKVLLLKLMELVKSRGEEK
ncbi:[Fe-Fe] hydrogenase large subunit C-terminal domain-containing protein [Thermosediminibacter litoriperuensis]|uniref:PAS domain S-box-containing protein n=1 Tax=Thermosediminibacter litoriperuensis TaxID=291989 RepID=A0A5S5ASL1_9FIRM|nr:[Fe-Fe] hydrogenase large subunit C-terminal domain-containing protein [Thermosediminibacter litoriperuensis]TYP55431.1 PAS domain S-box-containing protein [Thermosediminibacter litoriperuensis]